MKGRKHRATGGVNENAENMKRKNLRYTYQSNVQDEAEERKRGGMVEKKGGGKVHGAAAKHHAGRKARKSGGACDSGNPFSSARKGTPPKGRTVQQSE